MNRPFLVFTFLSFLCCSLVSFGSSDPKMQMEVTTEEAAAIIQSRRNGGTISSGGGGLLGQGPGCLNTMVDQVNKGLTSKFEQQQTEANSLMGISQKFFEHGKQCRNDLGENLLKFEQAKLELSKKRNTTKNKIRRQEIAYKRALLGVKRQCDATANTQFTQLKATEGNPNRVLTAKDGGAGALFGRNKRLNKFRKLFYDSCMSDPLTIEDMRLAGLDLAVNVDELETDLQNATESMASVTKQIEFSQDNILRNCAEGQAQLEYQEQLMRSISAQAAALVKKQNMFGLLGAGMTCVFGPGGIVQGYSDGTNGSRLPAATKK